jgi:hypothetical protein
MVKIDRTGMRFGRLSVTGPVSYPGFGTRWHCKCDCGNEVTVEGHNLDSGNTKSCGCSRIKHGLTGTRVAGIWKMMMGRCYDEKTLGYHNYGGRGITVCERWHDKEKFFADMGHPPSGLTLERRNGDKNYEPDNCYWATWKEQQNNKRNNVRVTAFGRTQTIQQWADETGINGRTLHNRIQRSKMDPEAALTLEKFGSLRKVSGAYSDRANNRMITAFGQTKTISAWVRDENIRVGTLRDYLDNKGMAPEEAVHLAKMTRREKFAYWKHKK